MQIGDTVKYKFEAGEYLIVADKETPYNGRGASPFHAEKFPDKGYDYIIVLKDFKPDKGKIEKFISVVKKI
jgi:hypothetical protein